MSSCLYNLDINNVQQLLNNKVILITGGTGSFGNKITDTILKNTQPKKLIIFSRDEYKQAVMKQKFSETKHKCLRYFIGDVRDYDRLVLAFRNVDIIFHAAALKQVPALEYNPTEAIKTNVLGTENVIMAAIFNNVKKVIAVSTDKCVNPVNLYGATKLCLEKLIIAANNLSGTDGPIFSVLRYGNVLGSRGSVLPIFLDQIKTNELTITDKSMTRFTMTIQEAINFVLNCSSIMIGGEIFVPKLSSYNILQLAELIGGKTCNINITGIRPGEKIDELMISSSESHMTLDCDKFYVITPTIELNKNIRYENHYNSNKYLPCNQPYSSGNNELIDNNRLDKLIDEYKL